MEIDPVEPPTWASIVKKEKRFSLDIQFNFVDNLTIPSASVSPSPPPPPLVNPCKPSVNKLVDCRRIRGESKNGVHKSELYPESSVMLPKSKRLKRLMSSTSTSGVIDVHEPLLIISHGSSSSIGSNSRSGSPASSLSGSAEEDSSTSSMSRPKLPMVVEVETCAGVQDLSIRKPCPKPNSNVHQIRRWGHGDVIEEPQDLSINLYRDRPRTSTLRSTEEDFKGVQDLSIRSSSRDSRPKGPLIIDLDEADGDGDPGELVIVEEESKNTIRRGQQLMGTTGSVVPGSESGPGLFRSVSFPTTKDNNNQETEVTEVKRRGRRRKDDENGNGGKPYLCFLCNFTSPREAVLNNHMTRMHTVKGNRGNVRCTICAYSCPTVEELRQHQELIHGGDDPEVNPFETKIAFHACTHCTKKFRSQSQLEAHLRLIAQKQLWKDLKARRIT